MSSTESAPAGRIAVIGDVGGHHDELRAELARLGADPDGTLPDDLVVVQVGDLVHRGPASAAVVKLVDRYLHDQPEHWVQLVGNHEAQYLREPAFAWPERLDDASSETLGRWWADGALSVAASIEATSGGRPDTGGEQFLITHAGLTAGFWIQVLDRLTGADRVAVAVNSLVDGHQDVLFHAGQMLGGAAPDPLAGPVWANAETELVSSWLHTPMPFSQLHGHSRLAVGSGLRSGLRAVGSPILRRTATDPDARHQTTTLSGGRIIGVDPGHGQRPQPRWRAWETVGRLTVAGRHPG